MMDVFSLWWWAHIDCDIPESKAVAVVLASCWAGRQRAAFVILLHEPSGWGKIACVKHILSENLFRHEYFDFWVLVGKFEKPININICNIYMVRNCMRICRCFWLQYDYLLLRKHHRNNCDKFLGTTRAENRMLCQMMHQLVVDICNMWWETFNNNSNSVDKKSGTS